MDVPRIEPNTKILGVEPATVQQFWQWAYSDILSNRNRGIFSEFIVGSLLGCLENARLEWDGADLCYRDKKIEVKSSAYLQNWFQKKPSVIGFDISTKKQWDANTNIIAKESKRAADIYVFCLLKENDLSKKSNINVLDLRQWEFYVVPKKDLEEKFGAQKRISLKSLKAMSESISFDCLKCKVDEVLQIA